MERHGSRRRRKDEEGFRGGGRGRGGAAGGGKGMNALMQRPSSPPRPPSHLLLTGLLYAAYTLSRLLHAPPTKKGKPAPLDHPSPHARFGRHGRRAYRRRRPPLICRIHAHWRRVALAMSRSMTRAYDAPYVRGSTLVLPLAPLLFGGREFKISGAPGMPGAS